MPEQQTLNNDAVASPSGIIPWNFSASQYDEHACCGQLMAAAEQVEALFFEHGLDADARTRSEDVTVLKELFSDITNWLDDNHEDSRLDELNGRAVVGLQRLNAHVDSCMTSCCDCGYDHVECELDYAKDWLSELSETLKDTRWYAAIRGDVQAFDADDLVEILRFSHRGEGFSSFDVSVDAAGLVTVNCDTGREVRAHAISGAQRRSLVELAEELGELDDELLAQISHLCPRAAEAVELLSVDGGASISELIDVAGHTGIGDSTPIHA